ncbi:MAG TPA: hypothetical protein VK689_16425, partial [Armatimonadota bacterium]|nr:hypothetical protein [Armatimonadota bacterium]
PQLTAEQALCWVHDARHYYQLSPGFTLFQKRSWTPSCGTTGPSTPRCWPTGKRLPPAAAARLEGELNALFTREVRFQPLARCLARTYGNKQQLLLVLRRPELPLHNNSTELAVRQRVHRRDVSFGPQSDAGRRAWDVYQSLAGMLEKLGMSFFAYLADRVGQLGKISPLQELIAQRAAALQVGRSWRTP